MYLDDVKKWLFVFVFPLLNGFQQTRFVAACYVVPIGRDSNWVR